MHCKKFPKGYVVKPSGGSASGGVPTHRQSFSELARGGGDPQHAQWMKDMVNNPGDFIAQEYVPIPKRRVLFAKPPIQEGASGRGIKLRGEVPDEWRLHVVGGKVVPKATRHRWGFLTHMNPAKRTRPEPSPLQVTACTRW